MIILLVGIFLILEFTVGGLFAIGIALTFTGLTAFTSLIFKVIKRQFELIEGLVEKHLEKLFSE